MQKSKLIMLATLLTVASLMAKDETSMISQKIDANRMAFNKIEAKTGNEQKRESLEVNIPVEVILVDEFIYNNSDVNYKKLKQTNSELINDETKHMANKNSVLSEEHSGNDNKYSYEQLSAEIEYNGGDNAYESEENIPSHKMGPDETAQIEIFAPILSDLPVERKLADISGSAENKSKSQIDRSGAFGLQRIILNKPRNMIQRKLSLQEFKPSIEDVAQAPIVETFPTQTGDKKYLNVIHQQSPHLQSLYGGKSFNPAMYTSLSNPYNAIDSQRTAETYSDIMPDQNSYPYSPPFLYMMPDLLQVDNTVTKTHPDNMPHQNSYPYCSIPNLHQVDNTLTRQSLSRNIPNIEYKEPNIVHKVPNIVHKVPNTVHKVPNYTVFDQSHMIQPFVEERRQVVANVAAVEHPLFRYYNYPFQRYG